MKFHGHLDVNQNSLQQAAFETVTDFPKVPVVGQICFKGTNLYCCINIDSTPVWIKMTENIRAVIVNFTSQATVTASHTFGTDVIVQLYDTQGRMLLPDYVDTSTENLVQVSFSGPQTGKIVILSGGASEVVGGGAVQSVAGRTGAVQLTADDISGLQAALNSTANVAGSTNQNFSTNNLNVTGDILPASNGTQDIGSPTSRFGTIYVNEARLSVNTLYLGDTAVMGTTADTVNIKADSGQSINVKTTGMGTTMLTSERSVNLSTTGMNADVVLQATGAGSQTRLGATASVVLTAPSVSLMGDSTVSGSQQIGGDLTVTGNFTVNGANVTVNSTTVTTKDNIIVLNRGQVGSGVTAGLAGLQIDRGDAPDYQMVFDETEDRFKVGLVGQLQTLASHDYVIGYAATAGHNHQAATTTVSGFMSAEDKSKLDGLTTTSTGINTGDETLATIKTKLGITTLSGSNTGDETLGSLKTKLGVTTLSGSNTGDQVIPTTLPASDVSAWAKASTKPAYTKSEVGLSNVDNTSDSAKPISTAVQTALDGKQASGSYLAPNGNASALVGLTGAQVNTAVTGTALTATSFNLITGLSTTAGLAPAVVASTGTSTLAARADHVHPMQASGDATRVVNVAGLNIEPQSELGAFAGTAFGMMDTIDFRGDIDGSVWFNLYWNPAWSTVSPVKLELYFNLDTVDASKGLVFETSVWVLNEGSTPNAASPLRTQTDTITSGTTNTNKMAKLTLTNGYVPSGTLQETSIIAVRLRRLTANAADTYTGRLQLAQVVAHQR